MLNTAPILITGLNGSLAPRVAQAARQRGYTVAGWDRSAVPPDTPAACHAFLAQLQPRAILHLATGSVAWATYLATYAAEQGIAFLFTSTAMVFDHVPDGPHGVGDARTAQDDYGRSKILSEDAVLTAHANAMVARIGWQIDPDGIGNNMLRALDDWQLREGCVAASQTWRPACSFMTDTAIALLDLIEHPAPGVHHLDSNAQEGHSFERIVAALQIQYQRPHWQIRVHSDYVHDQRLVGGPGRMPGLSERLRTLSSKGAAAGARDNAAHDHCSPP